MPATVLVSLIAPRACSRRSTPWSSVTLPTRATRIAGAAAITENRLTMLTCSGAPAGPRRRPCTTGQISRTMMPSSNSTAVALTPSRLTTTSWLAEIGVRPASTMKVANADSSARMTTSGPTNRMMRRPPVGAVAIASGSAASCRLAMAPRWVRPSVGKGAKERLAPSPTSYPVRHLYNRVADLRQLCGVSGRNQKPQPVRIRSTFRFRWNRSVLWCTRRSSHDCRHEINTS